MILVPIAAEEPSTAAMTYLRERNVRVPVYFDRTGAARRAVGRWATPEYYVLDTSGRVRFRQSSLDVVLAQAVAVASMAR